MYTNILTITLYKNMSIFSFFSQFEIQKIKKMVIITNALEKKGQYVTNTFTTTYNYLVL